MEPHSYSMDGVNCVHIVWMASAAFRFQTYYWLVESAWGGAALHVTKFPELF